jgi:hypothetical protein
MYLPLRSAPMRVTVALLASCAAVALAACGQASTAGDFAGEEETVASVIEDLESSGKRREADSVCDDLLTQALQDEVKAGSSSCAAEMKKALEDADAFDLEVQDVTVSGTKATAKVEGADEGDGVVRTLELEKVGADWRISSFGS